MGSNCLFILCLFYTIIIATEYNNMLMHIELISMKTNLISACG